MSKTHDAGDVVVVGAGIAGMAVAIKLGRAFPERTIVLLSKDKPGISNSYYAQGGIAAVMDNLNDSTEWHVLDTLRAGDGACNEKVVQAVVQEAPERLQELIAWGASFDHEPAGKLALGLEGGHSANRIVHHRDTTGSEVIKTLLSQVRQLLNVQIHWNTLVLDLIVTSSDQIKKCVGVTYLSCGDGKPKTITAAFTVLATGGIGQVFSKTTNPKIATGDGVAMAWRVGAIVRDMHLVQFHPTALKSSSGETAFLISEALRGFGAFVCTQNGNRFLFQYDIRAELAPRDIVARAIDEQSKLEGVYLDCRHLSKEALVRQFPTIHQTCLDSAIDITTDLIPITPAAHYLCGGIATNLQAQTSVEGLYAIGECACTGLHGANRLASNSLLEALVFAERCYLDIAKKLCDTSAPSTISKPALCGGIRVHELALIQSRLKHIMAEAAGIVRTNFSLVKGLTQVEQLQATLDSLNKNALSLWTFYETKNMLDVARLVLEHSLAQTQNRGVFYNKDLTGSIALL